MKLTLILVYSFIIIMKKNTLLKCTSSALDSDSQLWHNQLGAKLSKCFFFLSIYLLEKCRSVPAPWHWVKCQNIHTSYILSPETKNNCLKITKTKPYFHQRTKTIKILSKLKTEFMTFGLQTYLY